MSYMWCGLRQKQARLTGDSLNGRIDLLNTVYRGLKEELGVERDQVDSAYFTSFCFDNQVYDYKFTAVAITPLDEETMNALFLTAKGKDRYEVSRLVFENFPFKKIDIPRIKKEWAPEAIIGYVMTVIERYGERKLLDSLSV